MGQTAYINTKFPATAVKTPLALRLTLDVPLTVTILALLAIGALFVFSASWQETNIQGEQVTYLLFNQLKFIIGGIIIASVISMIDYHRYQRLLVPILVVTLIALVAVLLLRNERNGAVRTLFGGSVQPVEFAKLAVIIYLSFWLYAKREVLNNLDGFVLECNHDPELLRNSSYPERLKQRIGGRFGHLANETAAELLAGLERGRLKHVVAAHLSQKNNRPALAVAALARALSCTEDWICVADQAQGFAWREI